LQPYAGARSGGVRRRPPRICTADFIISSAQSAPRREPGIVWGIGAHVIKTGLSPVLVDLMERGFVSAIATNGAGIIHDFEIALAGATSEDVEASLGEGRFGMAENGRLLSDAIPRVSRRVLASDGPSARSDPAATVRADNIAAATQDSLTVHMPSAPTSFTRGRVRTRARENLRDFRFFVSNVAKLDGGCS
jgi:hypothetical protein